MTFDRENLFDELYLASYVINHYSVSSESAYESLGETFSKLLMNLMSEIEIVEAVKPAANMLKNVMAYHTGTIQMHSADGEMAVMKMTEAFEA